MSNALAAGEAAALTGRDQALAGAEGRNKTRVAVAHRVAAARSVRCTAWPLLYAPADRRVQEPAAAGIARPPKRGGESRFAVVERVP